MKTLRLFALAVVVPLAGCYNLLIVNIGMNRTASSLAAPLDPSTACAALAVPNINLSDTHLTTEEYNLCQKIITEKQKHTGGAKH